MTYINDFGFVPTYGFFLSKEFRQRQEFKKEKKTKNSIKINNDHTLKQFMKNSSPYFNKLKIEFEKKSKNKSITINEFETMQKILWKKTNTKSAYKTLLEEQDNLFKELLTATKRIQTNTLLKAPKDKNPIKNSYISTVFDLNKQYIIHLTNELEKINKTKANMFSKIPLINKLIFTFRILPLIRIKNSTAALNILLLRLETTFDRKLIKKELNQTYDAFAKAKINQFERKYDETNDYLGKFIKS
jgi:hypothetical protein